VLLRGDRIDLRSATCQPRALILASVLALLANVLWCVCAVVVYIVNLLGRWLFRIFVLSWPFLANVL